MKILIKDINKIVDENLTLLDRGILVTIILLKDVSPKLTLAKVKSQINVTKNRNSLIKLHDMQFIEWSGYKAAKKALENKKPDPRVIEVIDFMNGLYKTRVGHDTKSVVSIIKSRLKKHPVDDLKRVVANRYVEWNDCPKMSKNLRASTIFRERNFDKYLEEVKRTKQGENFVSANILNLKNGDEITLSIAKKLVKEDVYSIKLFPLKPNGEWGVGVEGKRLGKELVSSLSFRDSEMTIGAKKEFLIQYNGN